MWENIKKGNFQSIPRQSVKLDERRKSEPIEIECCGLKITVNPGVYQTSGDSELMVESIRLKNAEKFLEVGCGAGIISLALAKRGGQGVSVDINERAINNSKQNAQKHNITNVEFLKSDVFEKVKGKFDIIICNPPYTKHEIRDDIDRMFWDPQDEMKQKFFKEVDGYLKSGGRIYFGWANFADIDVDLPLKLAKTNGYKLINTFSKPHSRNEYMFYVLEFKQASK